MKSFRVFVSLSILLLPALAFAAGHVSMKVGLTAGSFTAEAGSLQGAAHPDGAGGYRAESITFKLDDLKSGIDLRDEHMKTKYLETAKYPEAKLTSATAKDGHFTGELLVRERTQKIEGEYSVEGETLKANFKTKMTDYNIAKISYMGLGVKEEVALEVELPITAAPVAVAPTPVVPKAVPSTPKATPAVKAKKK